MPGVEFNFRNVVDPFKSGEIDLVFWNTKHIQGLYFFPWTILVECKNLQDPVEPKELGWFVTKLKQRGLDYGILISARGITGNAKELTGGHKIISDALKDKIVVIIITMDDIKSLRNPLDTVHLIRKKLCELMVNGTFIS